jgi:peptidoglycan/LPS O-acetylase OafA/YrhL
MVHVAILADKVPGLGKALVKTGIYSYGLYLLHQPFVMYAGERLQTYTTGVFLILATALIVVVTAASMCLEYAVNQGLNRLRRG